MMRNIALPAALGAFLASHQVGAFLTPRIAVQQDSPLRRDLFRFLLTAQSSCGNVSSTHSNGLSHSFSLIINGQPRFNGICLFAESSDSDDNEELETEASTTTVLEAKSMGPDLSEDVLKTPTPPSQPPPSGGDAIAAALGGAVYGSAAGLYVDIATDIQSTDLPAQLPPPVALGVAVGAAA
ncbi:hypothetical protein THAOC_23872, partial [Thalassiosira oceanica]